MLNTKLDHTIDSESAGGAPIVPINGYDYKNQAWVKDGRYVECGHLPSKACKCFGRIHEGEPVAANADVH